MIVVLKKRSENKLSLSPTFAEVLKDAKAIIKNATFEGNVNSDLTLKLKVGTIHTSLKTSQDFESSLST